MSTRSKSTTMLRSRSRRSTPTLSRLSMTIFYSLNTLRRSPFEGHLPLRTRLLVSPQSLYRREKRVEQSVIGLPFEDLDYRFVGGPCFDCSTTRTPAKFEKSTDTSPQLRCGQCGTPPFIFSLAEHRPLLSIANRHRAFLAEEALKVANAEDEQDRRDGKPLRRRPAPARKVALKFAKSLQLSRIPCVKCGATKCLSFSLNGLCSNCGTLSIHFPLLSIAHFGGCSQCYESC